MKVKYLSMAVVEVSLDLPDDPNAWPTHTDFGEHLQEVITNSFFPIPIDMVKVTTTSSRDFLAAEGDHGRISV